MWRLLLLCLSCLTCVAGASESREKQGPPWVSCFADPPSGEWTGPKTVRTPLVTSVHGTLRAYAVIEAKAEGPVGCLNTVRLFVSTQRSRRFQQVYVDKGSPIGGTANSLGPLSWSPDGRWLLVAFGNWYYASDAGGLSILLYDTTKHRVILPDLHHLVLTALQKECSMRTGMPFTFDPLSRVHIRLADDVDEGDEEPTTHCFVGKKSGYLILERIRCSWLRPVKSVFASICHRPTTVCSILPTTTPVVSARFRKSDFPRTVFMRG